MNQYDYLEKLERLLNTLSYSERREIMYDYEEHFKEGLKDGKTEDELIEALGDPEKVASQYVTVPVEEPIPLKSIPNPTPSYQAPQKKGNGIVEIVALTLVSLFFNCILIGFYFGFWGVIVGFVATGAALLVAGFAVLLSAIVAAPIAFLTVPAVLFQYPVLMFIGSMILICIGGLMLIGMFYVIKATCIVTSKYIKWTIKFIRGF